MKVEKIEKYTLKRILIGMIAIFISNQKEINA